ncbi:MAG TPA: isoprenoid biosynthesis glyoxalase ElbB [Alcanivoracaceae bacterium]|nr:isoprenoid biosynthesis glyoxalase ElbB [Alcanivoracaceae bacterium]
MRVAVLLAGCGVYDGSEIYETTLTLLALDKANAAYQCVAPNIEQAHVINHATGDVVEGESRNVLVEAARLARGEVLDLAQADVKDYDALIVPGGFGVAKNLCDFAFKGADMEVSPAVREFVQAFNKADKPVGLMCIAPAMTALLFGEGARCTIGTDKDTAAAIEAMGAVHEERAVDEILVDEDNKLVTTPAYMEATRISEAAQGIEKLVQQVLKMASA